MCVHNSSTLHKSTLHQVDFACVHNLSDSRPSCSTAMHRGDMAAAEPRPVPLVRNGVQIRCKFSLGEPS